MPENFDFEAIKFTDGALTAVMLDKDSDPNKVIEKDEPSFIRVTWSLKTTDPWVLNNTTFHLKAVAELIGSGEVSDLASKDITVHTPTLAWQELLQITPNSNIQDGAYKIVVLLTHTAPYPTPPMERKTRLAGFYEIPMVQFYTHDT